MKYLPIPKSFGAGFAYIATMILAFVFLFAGTAKIFGMREFINVVGSYEATPRLLIKYVAYGVPIIEILVGGLLAFGIQRRFCLLSIVLMFSLFMTLVFLKKSHSGCGCFGGSANESSIGGLVIDAILLSAAVFVYWRERGIHVNS